MMFERLAHQPPPVPQPEKPKIGFRLALRAWLILLSGLLSLIFAWCWWTSTDISQMSEYQMSSAVIVLSEAGHCEITVIHRFHLHLGMLQFSRQTWANLPQRVTPPDYDASEVAQWRFGKFVYGAGFTYDGNTHDAKIHGWSLPRTSVHMIGFPYWFAVLITSFWPAIAAFSALRRAKNRRFEEMVVRGICPRCKYDLRATPMRCPECGWVRLPEEMRKEDHL